MGLFVLDAHESLQCLMHGPAIYDLCAVTEGVAALSMGVMLYVFKQNAIVGQIRMPYCKALSSFRHLLFCGGVTVNTRTMHIMLASYPRVFHRVVTDDGRKCLEHVAPNLVIRKEMMQVAMKQ